MIDNIDDFLVIIFPWVFGFILSIFLLGLSVWVYDVYQWENTDSIEVQCKFISFNHEANTREVNAVPTVVSGGKFGVGMVVTGHSEVNQTAWDCEEYGKLISDKIEVFRWAAPISTLFLKVRNNETRISGIRH